MRPSEFVTAYARDAVERVAEPEDITVLLTESRVWSHRWGVLLHDALTKRRVPPPAVFDRLSAGYIAWLEREGPRLTAELWKWFQRTEDDVTWSRALMELNFHRLNAIVQWSWVSLLYRPANIGQAPSLVDRHCYHLAVGALGFDKARETSIGEEIFFDPDAEQFRAWHTGVLTEIDAFIALQDMTRQHPNLIVLPAPAQFEHLAGPANVDFLVFDKGRGQVRGIQVKAQVGGAQAQHYDRSRVTLIDGARDLQNTRAVRTDPRHSHVRTVAWPGLIAAHYILEFHGTQATDKWLPRKELIQRKLAARHYVGTIPSRNTVAYAAVAERVTHDLTAIPSPPASRARRHGVSADRGRRRR